VRWLHNACAAACHLACCAKGLKWGVRSGAAASSENLMDHLVVCCRCCCTVQGTWVHLREHWTDERRRFFLKGGMTRRRPCAGWCGT
jgi:hypothetical protein